MTSKNNIIQAVNDHLVNLGLDLGLEVENLSPNMLAYISEEDRIITTWTITIILTKVTLVKSSVDNKSIQSNIVQDRSRIHVTVDINEPDGLDKIANFVRKNLKA